MTDTLKFLQVGEVARQINRSPERVRQYEREGKLPAIKTSRGVRLFRQSDVDKLISDQQGHGDE